MTILDIVIWFYLVFCIGFIVLKKQYTVVLSVKIILKFLNKKDVKHIPLFEQDCEYLDRALKNRETLLKLEMHKDSQRED